MGISGRISVEGADMPYITGDIVCADPAGELDDYTRPYVPKKFFAN